MKILKSLSILAILASACGVQDSFESGSQTAQESTRSKKKPASSQEAQKAKSTSIEGPVDDNEQASSGQDNQEAKATPENKTAEQTSSSTQAPGQSFSEKMSLTIASTVQAQMAQNPRALSPAEADALTQSLTALAQGAALGQGAQANAVNVNALLGLIGKFANVNLALGAIPAAVNAAAVADIAAAAQKVAAAAAALDLAGVQAAIADVIKAVMDLIG